MKHNNILDKLKISKNKTVYCYENVNEGLITSYNVNRCKKHLTLKFPEIFDVQSLKYDRNSNSLLYKSKKSYKRNEFFEIKLDNLDNLNKIQNIVYNLYGWFITRIIITYRDYSSKIEFDYIDNGFYHEYKNENGDTNIVALSDFLNNKISKDINYFSILFEAKFTIKINNII